MRGPAPSSRGGPLSLLLLGLLTASPAVAQVEAPRTGAELADFERTTSHAELLAFLDEVQARSPHVLVEYLTETNEGRPLPLVILGDPVLSTPGAVLRSDKPTVLITGSVHGNERAGKEGSLQLVRELAMGDLRPLLAEVNVLVVPSLNPDGAERPGRTNALGYDMNRDFIVAETPEISAVLDLLTTWWPEVFVDVHNGGAYPYNLTYQATLHPAADSALVAFARGPMYDGVREHIAGSDMITYWYSGPRRLDDGTWAWRTTEPWARKQHTYGGLQNIVTLLYEIPGRWSLAEQADNAREGLEGLLRFVAENPAEVRGVVRTAQRRTVEGQPGEIPLAIEERAFPVPETFFVMEDDEAVEVTGENRTLYVATASRPRPWAYALDGRFDEVVDVLRRHAVEVEQLTAPASVAAERYRVTGVEWADEPYQNHLLADVTVEVEDAGTVELPAGTYLVRTHQNAGRLLTHLLEPDTDDSLYTWNYFDHALPGPGDDFDDPEDPEYLDVLRLPAPVTVESRVVR